MDEMKIESKFARNVISKLLRRVLRKKLGYDIDIQMNELHATITDGKAHLRMDVDAELDKEELIKILKGTGME